MRRRARLACFAKRAGGPVVVIVGLITPYDIVRPQAGESTGDDKHDYRNYNRRRHV